MRVLFDFQAFEFQHVGGVSRYFAELMRFLRKYMDVDLGLVASDNAYLSGFPRMDSRRYALCRRLHRSNVEYSLRKIKNGKFDVFHPTYFEPYFLDVLGNRPFVLTVHDMISELYDIPGAARQTELKRTLVRRANHIVVVSENTKADLIRLMQVSEDRITVIYHGTSMREFPREDALVGGRYLLFVGSRWSYKGFSQFVKDVLPILRRRRDLSVVCTGAPFSEVEMRELKAFGVSDRFVHRFAKDDAVLYNLYSHAVAFVYPSEYEGFGIPILEAYRAKCPVMLRRASCFPEIAGDAAIYFNVASGKSDFEDQFERLNAMTGDQRRDLIDRQTRRLSMYDWETSAKKLFSVYEGVI